MADKKSDFVDLISDATRQYWRRPAKRAVIEAAPKEEKRLSNWPPGPSAAMAAGEADAVEDQAASLEVQRLGLNV